MSVPTVTSGNPYTAYLAALEDTLYQSPPASFYPRVLVLSAICVYGMLISVAYWKSLRPQYSSSQEEETLGGRPLPKNWTLRFSDGYACLNMHAVLPWGGCFACACMLVYTYTEYLVLAKHQYMGAINTYRSFLWLSVTLEGYFVTCCSLQAYVVVARKSERMNRSGRRWSWIPPPRVFNACFVFLTVGMAGSMIGSDIAFAISWTQAWQAICTLRNRLLIYEATWTGAMNVTQLLELQTLKSNVDVQVAQNLPFQHAVIGSLIVCAFLIAFLNIGSVALLLLLRRQIRASLARRAKTSVFGLQPQPPERLTFNKRDIPLPVPSPILPPLDPLDPNPDPTHLAPPHASPDKYIIDLHGGPATPSEEHEQPEPFLTRLALPVLAKLGSRKSSEATLAVTSPDATGNGWGAWKEKWSPGGLKARLAPSSPALPIDLGGRDTLLDLKRAERDLLICVSVVIAMGLMFGAENVWNMVYVLPNDVSWPAVEFSYFFCPWAFSIIYSTGCTFLVLNSLLATRRHRRREHAMSLTNDRRPSAMLIGGETSGGPVGLDTFLGAGPGAGHRDSANVGMGIEFGEEVGGEDLEAGGAVLSGNEFLSVEGGEGSRSRRPPVIRFPSVERKEGEKWGDGSA
ncbi:hypothetical protein BCR35DRAFT_304086 [Leucosporidium creatinivorum]|uniref:Proteophosphoglycan ppg4 n=1 Tax=Leucosporidium creatinivorum TaxID=106004 RepID=A0A1Y2FD49_9BASI|nr:hypothetical protein BCR35DRAFT_304086 [Leucosporidium creatinivorum]